MQSFPVIFVYISKEVLQRMGKKKMKPVWMNPFFKLVKMFLLLGATVIITVSLQGCQKNPVSTVISKDNKSDWTTYTDGNTVGQVLVKGNDLWAVTEGGVVRWNMDTGTYQKYTTADGLINNNVGGMTEDKSGNLWFVTGGVTEYNGKSWHSLPDINSIDSLSPIGVTAIAFDNNNNLYAGMSDGSIYLFNGKYQEIKSPDEAPNNGSLGIHGVLGMEGIKALAVDKNNTLWSFGADGTQRYDGKSWVASQDIPGFPEAHSIISVRIKMAIYGFRIIPIFLMPIYIATTEHPGKKSGYSLPIPMHNQSLSTTGGMYGAPLLVH